MESSNSDPAITVSQNTHTLIFGAYVVFLVVVAVGTIAFTIAVWRSQNNAQSAIQDNANARIEEAKRGSESAKAVAAAANQSAAEANERAAALEKEAALAKLQVEKLRTDRHLSQKQREDLASGLLGMAIPHSVVIMCAGGDDGPVFADDIANAIMKAKWSARTMVFPMLKADRGLTIRLPSGGDEKQYVLRLASVLLDCDLTVRLDESGVGPGEFEILIGRKWTDEEEEKATITATWERIKTLQEDRFLAGPRRYDLVNWLKERQPHPIAVLYTQSGEPERYAKDLGSVFIAVKWPLEGGSVHSTKNGVSVVGVSVTTTADQADTELATSINAQLTTAGVNTIFSGVPTDVLTITVGDKTTP